MYLAAFNSTQQALLAEKRLKEQGRPCKVIPTPREIDSSCGVSILTDSAEGPWLSGMAVRIYVNEDSGRWIEYR